MQNIRRKWIIREQQSNKINCTEFSSNQQRMELELDAEGSLMILRFVWKSFSDIFIIRHVNTLVNFIEHPYWILFRGIESRRSANYIASGVDLCVDIICKLWF